MLGFTPKEVRTIAYEFAEKLKIPHPFNREKEEAGEDWIRNFSRRHNLSFRVAEPTSEARYNAFTKESVKKIFSNLKKVYEEHNFHPANIYNCDETGISVVPKGRCRIVAKKGRRQVGTKTAAERGETVTGLCLESQGGWRKTFSLNGFSGLLK